jgi:hypothetical protein
MKDILKSKQVRNQMAQLRIATNSATNSIRQTLAAANIGNSKHTKQWADYGYPEKLNFQMLNQQYERFGIAKACVDIPVKFGWMDYPIIREGAEADAETEQTAWEKETAEFFKKKKLFEKLAGADRRNRIGDYSAFIVQIKSDIPDERDWTKPLSGVTKDKILKFIPVTQGQLIPNDKSLPTEDRYPLPNNYTLVDDGNQDGVGTGTSNKRDGTVIHHSRVIIFAEGSDDGTLNGIPTNESTYNALLDLEKISGAGAEGFWQAVSQKLVFESASGRAPGEKEKTIIDSSINEFYDGMNNHLMSGGFNVKPLNAAIPSNYKDPFMNSLYVVSAGCGIPATILIGQQTGRLASDEDGKQLAMSANSRRAGFQTEMVSDTIDWLDAHLIDYNVPEYYVEWSDLLESSQADKIAMADTLATANQKFVSSQMQGETAITEAEFRATVGLSAEKDMAEVDEKPEAMPEDGSENT